MIAGGELGLVGAVAMGLFGGLHCIGMCGGIVAALGTRPAVRRGPTALLAYNVGRIGSYSLMGALAGGLGFSLVGPLGPGGVLALRVGAGLFLVAAGLYLSGLWMGLARLERLGAHVWRRVAPLQQRIGPPDRLWKLLAAGAVWGWLPCGLVYAALAGALASGGVLQGALFMACFGLGTLPWLLAAGALAASLSGFLRRREVRVVAGLLVVLFGLWTAVAAVTMHRSGHSHGPGAAPQAPAAESHEHHDHGT